MRIATDPTLSGNGRTVISTSVLPTRPAAEEHPEEREAVNRLSDPEPGSKQTFGMVALLHDIWFGCWRSTSWDRPALLRLTAVFIFAAVCSWLGIVLSRQSEGVATIWLSNGALFGLLITQPRRRWLAYFLAGLTADTLADMVYGDPFRVAIGVSLANSVEVVASTLVLTRWFGSPLNLSRRRPLVGFLLVAVIGATAVTSALGASWTLLFYDSGPWWKMFRTWYLGDMLGMAILAPLLVVMQRPAFFAMFGRKQMAHTILVLSAPVLVTALVFWHSTDPLIFLMFPTLLLVAFRLGFPGTVVNIMLVTWMAIAFTIKGHGPLMLIAGEHMLLHRIVVAQVFGAIAIFTMFPVAALLEERQSLQDSLAVSEARFRELAHRDELTGMFNRRAFNLQLESFWAEARAREQSIAILLVDADLFKQYNDAYGHLAGDECLRRLAAVIAEVVQPEHGVAARFGGEEFAVILPDTPQPQAFQLAERIRTRIAALALPHPSSRGGVQTVSIGVSALIPEGGHGARHPVILADQALYAAKSEGRNRTNCASRVTQS
jgi:diguanylate cyclase (GGDEF)-like protein